MVQRFAKTVSSIVYAFRNALETHSEQLAIWDSIASVFVNFI